NCNMLNRIIIMIEILVNKTGDALELIEKQNTQTFLYLNCLALDYLLAQEGGRCVWE
ncbi:ENR1 protein, partial [Oreotrochilus melanogaster]|nr:ENR1 protein [Oreotrochilus melanogaster]